VKILSRRFRRLFLDAIEQAARRGALTLTGRCQHLAAPPSWQRFLGTLRSTEWGVYAKEPLRPPQHVLQYLARWTHRVAIANRRLVALENGQVTFRWKDYQRSHRLRTLTLDALKFLRRFMLPMLPRGCQRIRHCGFLANRVPQTKLAQCRTLVRQQTGVPPAMRVEAQIPPGQEDRGMVCPACQRGRLVWGETLHPQPAVCARETPPAGWDTSEEDHALDRRESFLQRPLPGSGPCQGGRTPWADFGSRPPASGAPGWLLLGAALVVALTACTSRATGFRLRQGNSPLSARSNFHSLRAPFNIVLSAVLRARCGPQRRSLT
jgi:hypothetical protein